MVPNSNNHQFIYNYRLSISQIEIGFELYGRYGVVSDKNFF